MTSLTICLIGGVTLVELRREPYWHQQMAQWCLSIQWCHLVNDRLVIISCASQTEATHGNADETVNLGVCSTSLYIFRNRIFCVYIFISGIMMEYNL